MSHSRSMMRPPETTARAAALAGAAPAAAPARPAAAVPAPPPAAPPDAFAIIARQAILRSLRASSPLQSPVIGDVARVGDRRVARWTVGTAVGYCELEPDADVGYRIAPGEPADHDIIRGAVYIDPFDAIGRMIEIRGGPDRCRPLDPTSPADREIEAFTGAYPHVSAILGLIAAQAFRLFDPGRCRTISPVGTTLVDWHHVLDEHCHGRWGELGRWEDTVFGPGQSWTIGLDTPEMQSRHAIATGCGWVRSRHRLPAGPGTSALIEITTALWTGRKPETLLTLAHVPEVTGGR